MELLPKRKQESLHQILHSPLTKLVIRKKIRLEGVGTANSISSNVLTFTAPHQLIQGESIRFTSDTAHLPDGIENNRLYYAITAASGLGTDQIKVAQTLNDALNEQALTLNNKGGRITVLS